MVTQVHPPCGAVFFLTTILVLPSVEPSSPLAVTFPPGEPHSGTPEKGADQVPPLLLVIMFVGVPEGVVLPVLGQEKQQSVTFFVGAWNVPEAVKLCPTVLEFGGQQTFTACFPRPLSGTENESIRVVARSFIRRSLPSVGSVIAGQRHQDTVPDQG
jgi:hypothetical protein